MVPTEIDSFLRKEMSRLGIPGLAVGLLSGNEIVYEKYLGFADVRNRIPVSPGTIFPLASISKQFTAAAIMILVQDGHVDLDSTLSSAVQDINFLDSWSRITVRNLLNQTTGLPNFMARIGLNPITRGHHQKRLAQEVVDLIRNKPLLFPTGEKFGYSNTNYFFLAEVIRAASEHTYDDFLLQHIFQPLKMHSTATLDPFNSRANRSNRYSKISGIRLTNRINIHPTIYRGSGGLESTLEDMVAWNRALNTEFPLTEATKSTMWTAPELASSGPQNYGFGWVIVPAHPFGLVWHNGMIPAGAKCWMGRYRKAGLSLIALSNYADMSNRNYSMQFAQICKTIADTFLPPAI